MIAKAKSISHGINDLNYITGVSANKLSRMRSRSEKKPEKIFHICDNLLPPGMDPSGIWNRIKLASMSHPRVTNNTIWIEISPSAKHTKDFTPEDWRQLWYNFVTEFDRQELKDRKGRVVSPNTNLAGSMATSGCILNQRASYRISMPQ